MDRTQVAVTGVGILTPIGLGAAAYWKAALAGTSGGAPVTHFDAAGLPARICSYVSDAPALDGWRTRLGLDGAASRSLLFALAAGEMAHASAGWSTALGGPRTGVV